MDSQEIILCIDMLNQHQISTFAPRMDHTHCIALDLHLANGGTIQISGDVAGGVSMDYLAPKGHR